MRRNLFGRSGLKASLESILRVGSVRSFYVALIYLLLIFLGCARHSKVSLEPLTEAQKSFYEIRSLHERGKSKEVILKAGSFLNRYPEEELARPVKYYLAVHTDRLGEKDLARKHFQEIMRLYPTSGWAQLSRSSLKMREE